ncbi:hypothetical protein ABKV19_014870 [Rosa sericea]
MDLQLIFQVREFTRNVRFIGSTRISGLKILEFVSSLWSTGLALGLLVRFKNLQAWPSCGVTVPSGLKMVCASCVTAASTNARKMNFRNLSRGPFTVAFHPTVWFVKMTSCRGVLTAL